MANEAQIERWRGEGGDHWVAEAARYDHMLRPYLDAVVDAAAIEPGRRVLDVGCGNGALTIAMAERVGVEGEAVGVDISPPMLATARLRAAEGGLDNIRFIEADAQVHQFEPERYDLLASRFGVMFFEDPFDAFANLSVALRPGGRVTFACWRTAFESEWISVAATALLEHVPLPALAAGTEPGPFAFADPDLVHRVLVGAGFTDVTVDGLDRRSPFGATVDDTVRFLQQSDLARTLTTGVDAELVARGWEAVAEAVAPFEGPDGVVLGGAAWIVTARRP